MNEEMEQTLTAFRKLIQNPFFCHYLQNTVKSAKVFTNLLSKSIDYGEKMLYFTVSS